MENTSIISDQILETMGLSTKFLILESIIMIISILTFIIIIASLVKIFRIGNIPGSKQMLFGLIGNILVEIVKAIYEGENRIISSILEIFIALFFLLSVYGFLKLANYLQKENNKNI